MTPTSRSRLVDNIEEQTGGKVVIDTIETDEILAKCCPQDTSPLFTLLPRELRDFIWAFATAPVEDQNEPFSKNAYYYRPGHTARLITDCNVLLTCRQAWLEAHHLPMLQAEHSFWYYRAAPDARSKAWMAKLTPLNRKHFGTLHLYAQMYAIENLTSGLDKLRNYFLPSAPKSSEDFQPSKFHVTIRHTDWYHWEHEAPLELNRPWFQAMLDSPDLRRTENLVLELETLDYKVSQLTPIVDRIKRLRSRQFDTHVINGEPTSTQFILTGEPDVTSWIGPTDLDGRTYYPYKDKRELKYHVVTLTWTLHFPQYPKAHIPSLRLAPQVHSKRPTHAAPIAGLSIHYSAMDRDAALEIDDVTSEPTLERWRYSDRLSFRELHERRRLAQITLPTYQRSRLSQIIIPLFDPEDDSDDDSMANAIDDNMDNERDETLDMDYERREILGWNQAIQLQSSREAKLNEWYRRRQFWLCMRPHRENHWRGKFAADKSLLRLEDDCEQ